MAMRHKYCANPDCGCEGFLTSSLDEYVLCGECKNHFRVDDTGSIHAMVKEQEFQANPGPYVDKALSGEGVHVLDEDGDVSMSLYSLDTTDGDNLTDGDFNYIDCPHCSKVIRDVWDYGDLKIGDEIDCPHCEGVCRVEDYRVEITLRAVGKAAESAPE